VAKDARVSVVWATIWIGSFYLITFILGFGAMVLVGMDAIKAAGGGGNMAAPLLAKAVAGDAFFGFICAVAFATILAVVAGLTLSGAAALAHDIWVSCVKGGHASEGEQLKVARLASVALGVCAIMLGIVFEGQNVAYMVGLTFSIAAAANFPALIMSIFWKKFTTYGAVWSILFGSIGTIVLIYLGPTIQVDLLKNDPSKVLFPLKNPCLVTMLGSFAVGAIVSLLAPEKAASDGFAEVERRTLFGADAHPAE
jgi:cation/acetate symporter